MTKRYRVYGIVWDSHENTEWEDRVPRDELPTETMVTVSGDPLTTRDEIIEELTDRYGWNVNEFCYKKA